MARRKMNVNNSGRGNGMGANNMAQSSARAKIVNERKALNSYFTFNRKVGNRFNIAPQKNKYGTPGIMSLYYTPSYGFNNDAESEIQASVNELYKYVRSYQTAAADYTAPDLMMYVLAAEQIFSWVAFLSRGFNAMQFSAYDNRYVPRVLTRACGFDYDNLKSSRTQFADHINYIIQTMCDYALPKQCSFSLRQEWMNSNVFMDAPLSTAQLYVLCPRTFLKLVETVDSSNVVTYSLVEVENPYTDSSQYNVYYSPTTGEAMGLVDYHFERYDPGSSFTAPVTNNFYLPKLKLSDIEKITEQLLTPFITMHMQDISGDIRHAFGDDNLRQWTPLMLGSDWTPIYDENALLQINNMTMVGHLDVDFNKLTENTTGEILLSNPCLYTNNLPTRDPLYANYKDEPSPFGPLNILSGDRILNMTVENPTPDEKLLATRWMNGVSYGTALLYPNTPKYRVYTAGTEIFEFAVVWYYDYSQGDSLNTIIAHTQPIYTASTPQLFTDSSATVSGNPLTNYRVANTILARWLESIEWLTSFSRAPILYITQSINDTSNPTTYVGGNINYQMDLANWTPLTLDEVAHLTNVDLSLAFIIR